VEDLTAGCIDEFIAEIEAYLRTAPPPVDWLAATGPCGWGRGSVGRGSGGGLKLMGSLPPDMVLNRYFPIVAKPPPPFRARVLFRDYFWFRMEKISRLSQAEY